METNILLENGTNELEVLEFVVNGNNYGINVAKVREIISYVPVTPIPNAHPAIEGIFMPRDILISAINLERILGNEPTPISPTDMMIITNFNKLNIAFHVHSVSGIHRVSWADIIKPDATITNVNTSVATGVVRLAERLIIILDFEKIVTDISPEIGLKISEIDKLGERDRNKSPILIAEDSPLLSKLIKDSLIKAGYDNIIATSNGQEAWDKLMELKKQGNVLDSVKCIVTDIEMPRMDGHRLTKLVKTDDVCSQIPLIIFSSLVNEEMKAKGKALGADAQLSKPEIGNLVRIIDDLIAR